ncbi:hypothetical protein I0E51_09320 [Pseudomonas lalucatii]|nr:hypothetical protein [Pseudomonas lalucatii]
MQGAEGDARVGLGQAEFGQFHLQFAVRHPHLRLGIQAAEGGPVVESGQALAAEIEPDIGRSARRQIEAGPGAQAALAQFEERRPGRQGLGQRVAGTQEQLR